ncbi:unnamed protein product, partial [Porites evermanni]
TEYYWEIEPTPNVVEQAACYSKVDPCPPALKDCSDEFVCSLSTNKCCCPSSVSTAPPTPKPKYCYENEPKPDAIRQADCYSKVDPCPPGLKDCSDEFVCPLSTNKCCCP